MGQIARDSHFRPDWAAFRDEIHCPLCGYNLRGLSEPRCPECGFTFQWSELLDPNRRAHPYLFEHHPERNWWSLAMTMVGTMQPRNFWWSLHPGQPSNPRRLALYVMVTALPLIAVFVALCGIERPAFNTITARSGTRHIFTTMRYAALTDRWKFGGAGWFAIECLIWPVLTFLALLVYQISMRRAKIRLIHVLRCVVYSCDLGWWLWLTPAILAVSAAINGATLVSMNSAATTLVSLSEVIALAMVNWRLIYAYGFYLRIRRPWLGVILSQVIVSLMDWKLWYFSQGY